MSDDFSARVISAVAQAIDIQKRVAFVGLRKSLKKPGEGSEWTEGKKNELRLRVGEIVGDDNFAENAVKVVRRNADEYFAKQLSKKIRLEVSTVSEEGIARAIGARAGIVLRSLHDQAIIEEDLVVAAAERIFERMGWSLDRAIRTRGELLSELQRRAAEEIEARVFGLVVRKLETIEDDVMEWVSRRIYAKTGCSISDIRNIEQTKKEVVDYSFEAVRRRMGIRGTGGGLKMTKRALQLRKAQRKFYQQHGDMHKYTKVT